MSKFVEDLKHSWDEMDPEVREDGIFSLVGLTVSGFILSRVIKRSRAGNYGSAILWAILWKGVCDNGNATFAARNVKRERQAREDRYRRR